MIELYGRPNSQHTQKVLWACAELNLPIRFIHTGRLSEGAVDPAYLRLNPNGLVPTLVEDGFVLWESNTIIRYLAGRYGAAVSSPLIRARGRWANAGWIGRSRP